MKLATPSDPSVRAYRHVYVHVPFCARRCSYCDFAIAVRRVTPVEPFLRSLAGELSIRFGGVMAAAPVDTLYFGGGTPSRLGGGGIAEAATIVGRHLALSPGAEVTVEANPEDVVEDAARRWVEAGVNRVSLGVQSFDPGVLAWMHRTHDVAAVHRAARVLADVGLENWSLDLIYALPPEVSRDWGRDLDEAIALRPTHVSAYGLTVEGGTPLARWRARGEVHEAADERHERDFLMAHERLARAGYRHYEVSNWALPGRESRHNSAYWREVPYIGLGPGAHGFDGEVRQWNEREYVAWRDRIARGEDPVGGSERLTAEQHELERLYVGLRTLQGVTMDSRDALLVNRWVEAGWGRRDGDRLQLTPMGWLRLDALVTALTEHRSRY